MKPVSIHAERATSELTILWDDGHRSRYSFSLLRSACPCAECRGGHENMGDLPPEEAFTLSLPDSPAIHMANIVPVGSYAVSPVWEDGHDAGIFRWEYLRALCPCAQCRHHST